MTLRAVVGLSTPSSHSVSAGSGSGSGSALLPSPASSSSSSGSSCPSCRCSTASKASSSSSSSSWVPSLAFSSSSLRRITSSGRGFRSSWKSSRDGLFVGSYPAGSSLPSSSSQVYVPLRVRSQQSEAAGAGAAGEPVKSDGALAFPSSFSDAFSQWWPMRSRPSMDGYKRAPPGQRTLSEAERARAIAGYLAYEPPASLAANPPWQLSFPHVCVATIASVLFGYHLGVVNVPLNVIALDLGFAGNTMAQGSVVSLCLLGAFIGCSVSGMVADQYGRRRSFQFSAIPMIGGAVLSATATRLAAMLAGRFLVGIGLGIAGPVTSLYVSEISPTNVRGTLGSLCQVATCVGILGAILAGLPVDSITGWWRACFWIATIPAALLAIGMEFASESPRWLFKQSQWAEAEHELGRLWGPAHAKGAMADLVRGDDEAGEAPWSALFDRKYFKVVFMGAALFGFQQLAGINAVFYFSSVVFKNAGVASAIAASVYMGFINLGASCLASVLMDRQGRRPLLVWSFSGMGIAMALQAAAAGLPVLAPYQGALSLFGTLSYVFMFALGAGPVPALLLPEIFAQRIRAKAMSVAMCVHWIVNFMVGLFFLQLLQQLGPSIIYSFFSAVCLAAALFVLKNVQETKGRSLEEIEALLLADL